PKRRPGRTGPGTGSTGPTARPPHRPAAWRPPVSGAWWEEAWSAAPPGDGRSHGLVRSLAALSHRSGGAAREHEVRTDPGALRNVSVAQIDGGRYAAQARWAGWYVRVGWGCNRNQLGGTDGASCS